MSGRYRRKSISVVSTAFRRLDGTNAAKTDSEIVENEEFIPLPADNSYVEDAGDVVAQLTSPVASEADRCRYLVEVTQLSYMGGIGIQAFFGSKKVLNNLAQILSNNLEGWQIKLRGLQASSTLLANNQSNQNKARSCGLLATIKKYMEHPNAEMRRWAAHALFYGLFDNEENQKLFTKNDLQAMVGKVVEDDWKVWVYNDALEMLKIYSTAEANQSE